MAKTGRISIEYQGKVFKSQKALLAAILADIEERKKNNHSYLEVDYVTYCQISQKKKEANIKGFGSVMGMLLIAPHNYSIHNKEEHVGVSVPNFPDISQTWHKKWIVYWGDSFPDYCKVNS